MNNKLLKSLTVFLFMCLITNAQETKKDEYPLKTDVETIDGIIKAYYEVVSGAAEEARDWERDKSLHHPNALISVTGKDKNDKPFITSQSLSDFHKSFGVPEPSFWEYEIKRETQTFGNITHVWSTYEATEEKNGPVITRGINSIQLYNDGNRYWILSWMYDSERTDNPIPKKYK